MINYIKTLLLFILMTIGLTVYGQPTPPGDPGGDPDNPVPITGIEILLAAGGLFGAKKIYDGSRKKK